MPRIRRSKFLSLGLGAFALVALWAAWVYFSEPMPEHFVIFPVEQGESFRSVSARLKNENLIPSEPFFYYLARLTGKSGNLKAGEYELHDKMSSWEILRVITGSQVKLYKVTIREGTNMFQIAQILRQRGLVDEIQFLEACWDAAFVNELMIPSFTVEGYLFPETYYIPRGASPKKIIRMFVDMFWSKIPANFLEAARRNPLSFHESVILASVIEKETGLAAEMGLISSVFYNRINKGMKLQSDPTAIYDLLPYGGRVTRDHLFRKTPFNTYAVESLPLTPVTNPGVLAIQAAIYPQESNYIYFVSRRDGSHHFSETYEEHRQAIDKYLR